MSFIVGIIGGGIAGSTIALNLAKNGIKSVLIDESSSLVNGPPMCHLHAGGALYRQIPIQQCKKMLKESIQTVKFYKDALNQRPTILAVPKRDDGTPEKVIERLKIITLEYQKLIQQDQTNAVLGSPSEYFRIFSKQEVIRLRQNQCPIRPMKIQDWMIPPSKFLDIQKLKFPLIMVQQYGLSSMRISAFANLSLHRSQYCQVLTNTTVTLIKRTIQNQWEIVCTNKLDGSQKIKTVNFLVNACGYRSGIIDDMIGYTNNRIVQFKASYITQWHQCNGRWPQIIIYGKRKTPEAMIQLTPYTNNTFQIHGMTQQITLFKDGLWKSSHHSSQPQIDKKFVKILQQGWDYQLAKDRTKNAINNVSEFIPTFNSAHITKKPLYGAQQIPGINPDLRATQITYQNNNYARAQIVKASTAIRIAGNLLQKLQKQYQIQTTKQTNQKVEQLKKQQILDYAYKLALERNYPKELAEFYQ